MTELLSFVDRENLKMLEHLVLSLGAGALIGMERSYHGRPAGFRTHALVCLASALLMTVTVYQYLWFKPIGLERVTLDPTRIAQGIMTGIGFLGAGVIMKEGLSVRGLTTAASIWTTAAIGILIGVGFYFPAAIATVLVLSTLTVFRWIEMKIPTLYYAYFMVRFSIDNKLSEAELRAMVSEQGFSIANLNYRLDRDAGFFEYRMTMRSAHRDDGQRLADKLASLDKVLEFKISPAAD
jgi:putative Mg2+ transporter-C (MgtC) family protein